MSLGREDMLRELELLPMWRSRVAPVMVGEDPAVALPQETAAEPIAPMPEPPVIVALVPEEVAVAPVVAIVAHSISNSPAPAATPTVTTTWLLVCPDSADADQQRLLQAIIQAMHLPEAEWTLSHHALTMADTQCRFVLLFGVEAANAYFNTAFSEVAPLRGQVQQQGDTRVVITHHPAQMLAQPLLKREVWQDVCLLLAEQG